MRAFDFFNCLDDRIPVSIYDEAGNVHYEGPLGKAPFYAFEGRDFIQAAWSNERGDMEIQVTGGLKRDKIQRG